MRPKRQPRDHAHRHCGHTPLGNSKSALVPSTSLSPQPPTYISRHLPCHVCYLATSRAEETRRSASSLSQILTLVASARIFPICQRSARLNSYHTQTYKAQLSPNPPKKTLGKFRNSLLSVRVWVDCVGIARARHMPQLSRSAKQALLSYHKSTARTQAQTVRPGDLLRLDRV